MQHNLLKIAFILCLILSWNHVQPQIVTAAQEDQTHRRAADKTFTFRNGVWIDVEYDPTAYPLFQVGFSSPEYQALSRAVENLPQYLQVGTHILFVHQGWAIELIEGTDSQPLVSTETRRPPFLYAAPQPIVSQVRPPTTPSLVAVNSQPNGLYFSFFMSWVELTGLLILMGLIGLGVWLGKKHPLNPAE